MINFLIIAIVVIKINVKCVYQIPFKADLLLIINVLMIANK